MEQKSFYDELRHLMESTSNENGKFLEHFELLQFKGMSFLILNVQYVLCAKGAFDNYMDKMRGEGVKKCLFGD